MFTSNLFISLLDKLTEDYADHLLENIKSLQQLMNELKQSIRWNLANMLNTRKSYLNLVNNYPNNHFLLLDYGLEDVSSYQLTSPDIQKHFCQTLTYLIHCYEPRLHDTCVTINLADANFEIFLYIYGTIYIQKLADSFALRATLALEKNSFLITSIE